MQGPLFLSVTFLALVACGKARTDADVVSTSGDGTTTAGAGVSVAREGHSLVRIVNTVVAAKPMTLTADDSLVAQGVASGEVTAYQTVRDNNVTFRVRPEGVDSAIVSNMEMLTDGARYTLVLMRDSDGSTKLRSLRDEVVPDSGKARFRVIQAVPGLNEVDVEIPGSTDPLFDDLKYGTEGGYRDLAPGEIVVTVRKADGGAILKREKIALASGAAHTIVLTGAPAAVAVIHIVDRAEARP